MRLITLFIFFLILPIYGQDIKDDRDIYDKLSELWEELRTARDKVISEPAPDIGDTLNISSIFIDYDYDVFPEGLTTHRLYAQLPPYLGIFSTQLTFLISLDKEDRLIAKYVSSLNDIEGELIFDDSSRIDVGQLGTLSPATRDLLDRQLHLYRTLGLPPIFRPEYQTNDTPVFLYFHGRDIDSLRYDSLSHWLQTLLLVCRDKMVYAVPSSITRDDETVILHFYLVLTTREAYGNHLLIIDEIYGAMDGSPLGRRIIVHFYPFVRVDNLLTLYGKAPHREDYEKMPLKIKRRGN